MHKTEYVLTALAKIKQTVERVISNSEQIASYKYYYMSPAGMERLESTCMLLIAIGESIKGIDKITGKELLPLYHTEGLENSGFVSIEYISCVYNLIHVTNSKLDKSYFLIVFNYGRNKCFLPFAVCIPFDLY